jgi:hypothetical protein
LGKRKHDCLDNPKLSARYTLEITGKHKHMARNPIETYQRFGEILEVPYSIS